MKIGAVIAALGTAFDAEDSAAAERVLREYTGAIPDTQPGLRGRGGAGDPPAAS